MIKVGDKVLRCPDLDDPTKPFLEGTVTKIKDDTAQLDGGKDSWFYTAFLWPMAAREELMTIISTRAKLKRAYDDSISLVYELRNKIARGEIKF